MAGAMQETFELVDGLRTTAVIRVMGVGGGGCNTVNQMSQGNINGVEFICANTDRDHLEKCIPNNQLQLGTEITRGLGSGSKPDIGRQVAGEERGHLSGDGAARAAGAEVDDQPLTAAHRERLRAVPERDVRDPSRCEDLRRQRPCCRPTSSAPHIHMDVGSRSGARRRTSRVRRA